MTAPTETSLDLDGIREMLVRMLSEGRSAEAVELIISLLQQMKSANDQLQFRLARLVREKFGRKSEKLSPQQLLPFLQELLEDAPQPPEPDAAPLPPPRRPPLTSTRRGRRSLPAALPHERIVLEPGAGAKVCAQCGEDKKGIGQESSEVLEFVPGHFKVIVYVRAKYACRRCGGEVTIGPVGPRPIESGLPGFGLMADVLVKKYAEHAPLHRIRGMYRRLGVDLPVSSLSNWVGAGAQALEPIAQAIAGKTLAAHVVQTDDTGVTVLDRDRDGGSKRGHQWAYLGDLRWLTFHYTPTRSADGPCEFLAGRRGWVQADAYSGYDRLFRAPGSAAVEVGCWSHARRYYLEALPKDRRAAVALHYIGQLFDIERQAKQTQLPPEARREFRQQHSRPVLDSLGRWVKETYPAAAPKSPLGQAVQYTVNQWIPLTRFCEDGRLELENNACERALRQVAVGRKNWLFAGSDEGARWAAVLYSVLGTCRLNGVEPWSYIRDVLEKLAGGWPNSRLEELLPPNWAAARAAMADTAEPPAAATA